MLAFVAGRERLPGDLVPQKPMSARKLRLFLVGCCRRYWFLYDEPASRPAVEMVERLADGLTGEAERLTTEKSLSAAITRILRDPFGGSIIEYVRWQYAAWLTTQSLTLLCSKFDLLTWSVEIPGSSGFGRPIDIRERPIVAGKILKQLLNVILERRTTFDPPEKPRLDSIRDFELTAQANLLRCIAGDPFRPLPSLPTHILAWPNGIIVKLASRIYEERDFTAASMGILADALEDAGIVESKLLTHLRHDKDHARGCWAIDTILGRDER